MSKTIHTTCALILILLYLLLPATAFTHDSPLQDAQNGGVSAKTFDGHFPCDDCPCSESQDSDCCESDGCCSCHAPLTQHITIVYSPFVSCSHCLERHPAPPQVYLSIFVPPQNFSI